MSQFTAEKVWKSKAQEFIAGKKNRIDNWDDYQNLLAEYDELSYGFSDENNELSCIYEKLLFAKNQTEVSQTELDEFDFENKTINELKSQEETYEEEKNAFSMEDWSYLNDLMKKYEIVRDSEGYRELARKELGISPGAYLGKFGDKSIYFTTQAMYVHAFSDESVQLLCSQVKNAEAVEKIRVHMPDEHILSKKWIRFEYSEIDLERMLCDKEVLVIPNISGATFRFTGSEEECNKLVALLRELKGAKTTEYDKYMPTWCVSNTEYAQILIDFLKLGQHSVVAALVKASTIVAFDDEEDKLFQEFCKHGLSQYAVTIEELKDRILAWEATLDVHVVDLYIKILVKDLIEVLQMATGEPSAMLNVEKQFFDWLLQEAGVNDGQFLDMVRLPYFLLDQYNYSKAGVINYNIVLAVEEYAYSNQLHIPYEILDNEKSGLWSELHRVTEEYKAHLFMTAKNKWLVEDRIKDSMHIECCNICMSIYLFLCRAWSVEPSVVEWDDVIVFIEECGLNEKVKNVIETNVLKLFDDEGWDSLVQEYLEYDRRSVGRKMVNVETLWIELLDKLC